MDNSCLQATEVAALPLLKKFPFLSLDYLAVGPVSCDHNCPVAQMPTELNATSYKAAHLSIRNRQVTVDFKALNKFNVTGTWENCSAPIPETIGVKGSGGIVSEKCLCCSRRMHNYHMHKLDCGHHLCRGCLVTTVGVGIHNIAWGESLIDKAVRKVFDRYSTDFAASWLEKTRVLVDLWENFGLVCCKRVVPFTRFTNPDNELCIGSEWHGALRNAWNGLVGKIERRGQQVIWDCNVVQYGFVKIPNHDSPDFRECLSRPPGLLTGSPVAATASTMSPDHAEEGLYESVDDKTGRECWCVYLSEDDVESSIESVYDLSHQAENSHQSDTTPSPPSSPFLEHLRAALALGDAKNSQALSREHSELLIAQKEFRDIVDKGFNTVKVETLVCTAEADSQNQHAIELQPTIQGRIGFDGACSSGGESYISDEKQLVEGFNRLKRDLSVILGENVEDLDDDAGSETGQSAVNKEALVGKAFTTSANTGGDNKMTPMQPPTDVAINTQYRRTPLDIAAIVAPYQFRAKQARMEAERAGENTMSTDTTADTNGRDAIPTEMDITIVNNEAARVLPADVAADSMGGGASLACTFIFDKVEYASEHNSSDEGSTGDDLATDTDSDGEDDNGSGGNSSEDGESASDESSEESDSSDYEHEEYDDISGDFDHDECDSE